MNSKSPACAGCFTVPFVSATPTNPMAWPLGQQKKTDFENSVSDSDMTEGEKNCLTHLALAWNQFVALEGKHPSDDPEFLKAIHDAQKTIALRVARRVNKEIWSQWE